MYVGTLTILQSAKRAKPMPPVEAALIARLNQECDLRAPDKEMGEAGSATIGQLRLAS